MRHIVFVGDKPSSKNKNPAVPFVGTQSYKVLLSWFFEMDIDITWVMLCNKEQINLWSLALDDDKFRQHTYIALGNEAAEELDKHRLEYFKLPHPSPKNRVLNDKNGLFNKLKDCRKYLDSKGWI